GGSFTVTVTYTVASTVNSQVVHNTASAASDEDSESSNDATVSVVEDVRLSVTKTFNSDTVTAGGASQTFTISISNAGVSDADNVLLTDTVPGRLIVDSISAGDYTCTD